MQQKIGTHILYRHNLVCGSTVTVNCGDFNVFCLKIAQIFETCYS